MLNSKTKMIAEALYNGNGLWRKVDSKPTLGIHSIKG